MLCRLWSRFENLYRCRTPRRALYRCHAARYRQARRPVVRFLEDRTVLSAVASVGGPPDFLSAATRPSVLAPAGPITPAGATLAAATPITPFASVLSSTTAVAPGAFFVFHLTQAGQVTASVSPNLNANVSVFYLALFDSAGILLAQEGGAAGNVITLSSPLLPGAATGAGTPYYLEVQGLHGVPGPFALDLFFHQSSQSAPAVPVGALPSAQAVGDFNGDRHPDIAFADQANNAVTIALGKGDGTFTPGQTIHVGQSPDALVAGFFNGDRHLDLAVASWASNTVQVLLGNGDGTFTPGQLIHVGQGPDALVAGYFSGGHNLDLAVANQDDGTVTVLQGQGDGTFHALAPVLVGGFPRAMVVGDFNGDHVPDLAVVDPFDSTVTVLLGQGHGAFHALAPVGVNLVVPVPATLGGMGQAAVEGIVGVVAADFDNDGDLDLVVYDQTHTALVFLPGNGDGTFGPPAPTFQTNSRDSLVVGDFNGDGLPDLAESDTRAGTLTVLFTKVDSSQHVTFNPLPSFPATPGAVAAADFNGDGHADLSIVNSAAETVTVVLGRGDGTFVPGQVFIPPGQGQLAAVGIAENDFNGDGTLDLAVASGAASAPSGGTPGAGGLTGNFVTVLLGNGDGTYAPRQILPVAGNPTAIVARDFNGDGIIDLAVAEAGANAVQIFLGEGDGTFTKGQTIQVGRDPEALVPGDFTGQGAGHFDLAVANAGDNTLELLLDKGGTFTPGQIIPVGQGPDHVVTADFNGRSYTTGEPIADLAVSDARDNQVQVFLGNGNGTFSPGQVLAVGQGPDVVIAGAFNSNSTFPHTTTPIPDLAVAYQTGGTVTMLLGKGDGTFTQGQVFPAGPSPLLLASGHFYGSKLDLAVGGFDARSGTATLTILPGQGDGTFKPPQALNIPIGGRADVLRLAPVGKGATDLILGTSADNVLVLTDKGNGNFATAQFLALVTIIPTPPPPPPPPPPPVEGPANPTEFVVPSPTVAVPLAIFLPTTASPPPVLVAVTPLSVAAEGPAAVVIEASAGAGPVAESAITSTGSGPDDVIGQVNLVAAVLKPEVILPGSNSVPEVREIIEELIVGGKTPLPGQANAGGRSARRRVHRTEQDVAKTPMDGNALHFSMVGLNYTPTDRRSRPRGPAKPRAGALRRPPGADVGSLPSEPAEAPEPSLLERAVTSHPLRLGLVTALTAVGIYGLTVWFGARARPACREDEEAPAASAGGGADS
jgi:hypothetical protein